MKTVLKAKIFASKADMTQEQWLESRRQGIGGSDASAILGHNPYTSAYAVYLDKLDLLPEKQDNEAMRQGRDFEEYVAKRFTEYMEGIGIPKKVKNCNYILNHPKHSFMLANVDRLVVGENAGLECKTTSVYNKTDFEGGDVPPQFYIQCQHYMAVTGADKWYLAILILNKNFYVFEIPRSEKDIQNIIQAETVFWNNNVLAKVEPVPSGSERDSEILQTLYAESCGAEIDLMPFSAEIEQIAEVSTQIAALEQKKEKLKQSVINYMKDAESGCCDGFKISYKTINKNSLDSKRLKSEQPQLYESYAKNSSYRAFKIISQN